MTDEVPLYPEWPIVDPHLHFWDIRPGPESPVEPQTFLLPEASAMVRRSGQAITHTVFVECHAMYRATGPAQLRSLGETEFANGVAATCASGSYGATMFAHRIVANVDLRLGDAAAPVLEAHAAASAERLAGIRNTASFSEGGLFGSPCDPAIRGLLGRADFRAGAAVLARMGLSLDLWCLHTQLGELAAFADALPDLLIVLDHIGTPERLGPWEGCNAKARAEWIRGMAELAERPNVRVKLGGMGMDITGPVASRPGNATSQSLEIAWRPYVEPCVEAFGPSRCMFESNFPPDQSAAPYGTTWNAFKRIAAGYSDTERDWLFRRTAAQTYRM